MVIVSRRVCILLSVVTVACSSGGTGGTNASSLSIGEGGSEGGSQTTASTGGASASATVSASEGVDSGGSSDASVGTSSDADSDATDGGSTGPAPASCDEDPEACNAWFLPRGASQWEAVTIGGPASLVPDGPVLAAFDIEAPRIAFVVTASEVARVDLERRTWLSKTTTAELFAEVDVDIAAAYSIPAYWGGMPGAPESVAIVGSDVAFLYDYDVAGQSFAFDQATALVGAWDGPGAPALAEVREMWLDVTNDDGWASQDVSVACPGAVGPVGPYVGIVTDDAVQVLDAGYCFDFFPPVAFANFEPMSLAGAPTPDRVGGITYNESTGLVVFAAD